MRIQPPTAEVLRPEHPRLAISTVGDRSARLGGPCGIRSIKPVEILATLDIGLKIGGVVNTGPAAQRIEMRGTIPPVGKRQIIVDADEADVGISPERIEVKIEIAGAIARLLAEVFRPVGGIADLGA